MNKRKNQKTKKQKVSESKNVFMFLLPLIILISALLITSTISVMTDIGKQLNFPVITVIFSLCTFLTAYLAANRKREKGLITGVIYNLPSLVFVLLVSLILNGFSADLNLLLSFITMLISSSLGGVIGVNHRQKSKKVKK